MSDTVKVNYLVKDDAPTLYRFLKSDTRIRGVIGPVGSGKSSCCSVEVVKRAGQQAPDKDGVRRSRWVIIRNTYRELKDTTVRTFLEWFPEGDFGRINREDMAYRLNWHSVETEILFRALDQPRDISKLLSTEYTGAWVNEAREVPLAVIEMLDTRIGRFPSKRDGPGASWDGIWMDTNPPDTDHWWYRKFEEERPSTWEIFRQPSGRSPTAENIRNLKERYYENAAVGKSPEWVKVYMDGAYGYVQDGKPVHPEYRDSVHCKPCKYVPGRTLVIGLDFGLTPAACFMQMQINGQWRVLGELCGTDIGVARFAEVLAREIQQRYPDAVTQIWGDPAGDTRDAEERTVFDILRAHRIMALKAPSQDPTLRREALGQCLRRMIDGEPGIIFDPACTMLRKGLAGKFQYRRIQVSGAERYEDKVNKNEYSHPCFVAGTRIDTPAGRVCIESLQVGDAVCTPLGPRRVLATGVRDATVVHVWPLTCTPDHPIWTAHGYVRADALQYGQVLATRALRWKIHWWLRHYVPLRAGQFLSSMASGITAVRRAITAHHRVMVGNTCTALSGWQHMASFRQAMMYTIATAIRTTIDSPTWNVSRTVCIASSTCWNQNAGGNPQSAFSNTPFQPPLVGAKTIPPPPVASVNLPQKPRAWHWLLGHSINWSARGVAAFITPVKAIRAAFCAATNACRRSVEHLTWTMRHTIASVVEKRSLPINTPACASAAGVAPVYMLGVDDTHCYYANGILVSNCEALEYALLGGGENARVIRGNAPTGPIRLKNDWSVFDRGRRAHGR